MDNSWQIKCSSTWQSSTTTTPSMPSSSQLQPQESRNQMVNTGHYFYPHVAQEPRSTARGLIQEPMFSNASNLGSYKSGDTELGNSFLALLSGPPSLLQSDFPQLSNPKPFTISSKLPVNSSSVIVSAAGSGHPVASSGSLSHNLGNQNPRIGADLCPVISSREVVSTIRSSASVFHDDLRAANLNFQSSDLATAVIHHTVPGNEKVRDFSSLRGGWPGSTSSGNVGRLRSTNIQASQKVPPEAYSSVSSQSATLTCGCPRVFCLGTSGDLLLSNTGLLGVVCLCHGLHMSLAKFCEHSGLCAANPGDAVRMDSGETIAQWRKLYFHKFGIRVPEDHSGWDWPEGFSATAGLVKCSATVPNMSKNSDLSHLVGSSGGLVRSGQPWNNVVFPKNHYTGQTMVNEVLHSEQQRNAQDSCNFLLKGLIGTSQSNFHTEKDNQIMECPISRCSTMSKLVGRGAPDNGFQSISAYIDSISKSGNSFISHPTLQDLKTLGKDSDISRFNNSKEGVIADRDVFSSNVELRLGQPSQRSWTIGNQVLSVIEPQLSNTPGDPQKSLFQEQLINSTVNSRVVEECRQYLQCAARTPNSSTRRERSQMNQAFGANNAIDAAKIEKFKGDAAKSSVISMLLSSLNTPSEGNVHSKATNNMVNGSEHSLPRTLHCESHIAKSDSVTFPWNRGDGTERQLNINELALNKHMDKGKGVGSVANGSYVATESSFGVHTKQMEKSSFFTGVFGGSGHPSGSAVYDKNFYSRQLSGVPPDASDASNPFNYSGKISCLGSSGHLDHVFLRSSSLPMDSGPIFPSQAVSTGFSSSSSMSVPNLIPALSNKEGIAVSPYMLDENLRLLALRHRLELSKREHAIASLGMNQEQGKFNRSCDVKIQGSIVNPSTSAERRDGPDLTSKRDVSEVAMKPFQFGATCWMGGDNEKLVPLAGLNKWCGLSTFTQGISLLPKEIDMQCQLSYDSHPTEQPSLRLGRSESNITPSEHVKCCQRVPYTYFPGKCSCAIHTNCLAGNCDSKGKTSFNSFKEPVGSVGGNASMLFASKFDKHHIVPKEKGISLDQSGKLEGQISKKIDCHASQWRDVPSKVIGVCNVTCIDQPADVLDVRRNVEDQIADTAAKCFNGTAQEVEALKEQEMSNISSGCSAPAVTQASIEVNNMDSCTVDAGYTRYANDLVVDEGSGIDKCWSSDDALDSERSAEFLGFTCKIKSTKEGSSKTLPYQSSRSLIDELRLRNSFRSKKVRNQTHTGLTVHEKTNHTQKFERGLKTRKRKGAMKWKMLDASFPASGLSSVQFESPKCTGSAEWHSCSSKDMQMLLQSDQGTSHPCGACSIGPSFKRRRSALFSAKTLSRKRDLHRFCNHGEGKDDYQAQLNGSDGFLTIPEVSGGKKFRRDWTADGVKFQIQESNRVDAEKTVKYNSVDCINASSSRQVNVCNRKARPVVCGKYGVISNGKLAVDVSKPAKIVSLSRILRTARRCTLSENDEPRLTSTRELKKTNFRGSRGCFAGFANFKKLRDGESHYATVCNEVDPDISMEETEMPCFPGDKERDDELSLLEKERDYGSEKNHIILDSYPSTRLNLKCKEIRKRSLYELTVKGKKSCSVGSSVLKISNCEPQTECRSVGKFLKNAKDSNAKKATKEHRCQSQFSILDSDAFCCVCGSSNKDEINCLLECSRCLMRVHQACYGVSKVPRGRWYCRPCRTSSKDIVCVLCGYGGGAMTRALRSRNIVKSLLKAWNIVTESRPKNTIPPEALLDKLSMLNSSRSGLEGPINIKPSCTAVWKMDLQKQLDIAKVSHCSPSNFKVHNSITVGVLDSTVKQWVHMVCGLWTPGTRCPNVDTMSAFDVSGASRPSVNVVCSMCNRQGGSCIQCRVVDCSVQFHPWCAHQKGLLQSEIEGIDNENVGFYGRCVLHATNHQCGSVGEPIDTETDCPGEKELVCARTEGYKGRKREGFRHNVHCQSNGNGGCLVPQEQLNAWLHINGQKSCTKGLPRPPISDIEYDCRKEYARYKQVKGWKHLVVYKSGIHALGLYTSRFISRGAMVVEYVGEIVGLRVADKRETEYQSGRKLQYKSACYFFRIDKEHIIDATRKGGIARFVNHSCLPNCVAKVISVRNEKKVVFFAERDINPGEEITYDYHFNHEDEGKKIPCFCNSRNCRRYLN